MLPGYAKMEKSEVMIMLVGKGLEMLEIPQSVGFIHPVLFFDETATMLVDTGYPKQEDLLVGIVEAAGHPFSSLSHILITHHDIDHIGGLRVLHERYPKIQVMAHEVEVPFIDGSVDALKIQDMERDVVNLPENKKAFLTRMKTFFPHLTCPVDFALDDYDVLEIAGGIEVVFTPGHTLGHICLYHYDTKTLIAGDALNLDQDKLVGANPEYTHDTLLAAASLKRLEDLDIENIITYHGGLLKGNINEMLRILNEKAV
jgi:glyoxylase-like metal-dependent hydrolase (beta-lactamase superfamily II)